MKCWKEEKLKGLDSILHFSEIKQRTIGGIVTLVTIVTEVTIVTVINVATIASKVTDM